MPQFADSAQNAPLSALVWWIIPLLALVGGIAYAIWVSRLKRRYENQTERSVGRFKKFQDSFNVNPSDAHLQDTNSSTPSPEESDSQRVEPNVKDRRDSNS